MLSSNWLLIINKAKRCFLMKFIKKFVRFLFEFLAISFLLIYSFYRKIFTRKKLTKVIFGTSPLINNKYWSDALSKIGVESETLMATYCPYINQKKDYDKYFDDVVPKFFRKGYMKKLSYLFFVWIYIINNAKIFVMPFCGVVFTGCFWKIEYFLFRINNIKVMVLPYGADAYMYSKVVDVSLQNALLLSFPCAAKNEKRIEDKVFFWSKHADFTMSGFMCLDGMPRWDTTIHQFISINTKEWKPKNSYLLNDGKNGVVKILHTPNHRGFKGTEFLIKAVDELKEEGLKVELVLLEKVSNERVKEIMCDVDVLAEQFIATGYALSGIEGMATGLPVLANLDNEIYTDIFRRYSFLNECPILSTRPETIKDNLRFLITRPELREELGKLGRQYVEKYHSYKMAQYLFANIFKSFEGENIDLMNLFHPLKSEYVQNDYIKTPLLNNKYVVEE